jgi:chromosomal replication initiation ATPase DnaA
LRELLGAADARALERTRARAEALRPKSSTHDPAGTSPKRETYRDRLWAGEPGHVFENLMGDVADAFRLSESDIRGPGQLKTSVTARQTFAYLARYVLKVRQSEITKYLNRTPSSFGSAKLDLRWKMVRDPALHATVTKLEADWRAKVQKLVAPVSMETDEEAREGTG